MPGNVGRFVINPFTAIINFVFFIINRTILIFLATFLSAIATRLPAQSFRVLHTFTGGQDGGTVPSGLLLFGNVLYGSNESGGSNGVGTIFRMNIDGSAFTVIHHVDTAKEGFDPSDFILLDNKLFAIARDGGVGANAGTVFCTAVDDGSLNTLHSFTAPEAVLPRGGVLWGYDRLYGTTEAGGTNNTGVVYSIRTNGSEFSVIYSFSPRSSTPYTNVDGISPVGRLCLSGTTLYGVTTYGGSAGNGTIYSINLDGSGFKTLHHFTGGADGVHPPAGLIEASGRLYGTTSSGGGSGNSGGTIYSIATDGTDFTILHTFAPLPLNGTSVNDGGAGPVAELAISGDTLFGITKWGGSAQNGTVFMLNSTGSNFITLHNFSGSLDGASPSSALALGGDTLYGTTYAGGTYQRGIAFALTIQTGISSLAVDGTNLSITATNGLAGQSYKVLRTTNLKLPLVQWASVATSTLTNSGKFTIVLTNAVNPTALMEFYCLQAH